jgi:hypothetical protein
MDTSNHHYSVSIFRNYNPMWWNGEISWKNKYIDGNSNLGFRKLFPNKKGFMGSINYPVQLTDAWHFFKTLMIVFLVLSIITFDKTIMVNPYGYITVFVVYGIIWNIFFNIFYNKILKV